jgi:lipopolysaccharide transport system ATP-binding protein
MSVVLRVENLGKAYRLGVISRKVFWHDLAQRLRGDPADPKEEAELFWALREVSFDLRDGEVLGLLGRNGAGKTTLLKVISRITSPTSGEVKVRGRIASLLEVGTGFHMELTGRDNVFLNGIILGMTRGEVRRKFDEIVAFSGVEEFIDTPVKRYSVGMRVRLAFAVAAHLEPEILLIDEVLAVGDAVFQQRCLGKIGEVARSGRTVIFVSHNAASIEALCTRGLVLEHGRLAFDGTQIDAIDFYAASRAASVTDLASRTDRHGTGEIRVTAVEVRNARGATAASVHSGEDIEIALHYDRRSTAAFPRLAVQIDVATHLGAPIFTQANWLKDTIFDELPTRGTFVCRIPRLPLPAGKFHIGFRVAAEKQGKCDPLDSLEDAAELNVEGGDYFGSGKAAPTKSSVCLVDGEWRVEAIAEPAPVLTP